MTVVPHDPAPSATGGAFAADGRKADRPGAGGGGYVQMKEPPSQRTERCGSGGEDACCFTDVGGAGTETAAQPQADTQIVEAMQSVSEIAKGCQEAHVATCISSAVTASAVDRMTGRLLDGRLEDAETREDRRYDMPEDLRPYLGVLGGLRDRVSNVLDAIDNFARYFPTEGEVEDGDSLVEFYESEAFENAPKVRLRVAADSMDAVDALRFGQ